MLGGWSSPTSPAPAATLRWWCSRASTPSSTRVRFGGELLGAWTADADELAALSARLAPDVELAAETVPADELAAVVPRAQVVAVARRPPQPDPDELLALPGPGAGRAARGSRATSATSAPACASRRRPARRA